MSGGWTETEIIEYRQNRIQNKKHQQMKGHTKPFNAVVDLYRSYREQRRF